MTLLQWMLLIQTCFLLAQIRQLRRITRLRAKWQELLAELEDIHDRAIIEEKRREMDL